MGKKKVERLPADEFQRGLGRPALKEHPAGVAKALGGHAGLGESHELQEQVNPQGRKRLFIHVKAEAQGGLKARKVHLVRG